MQPQAGRLLIATPLIDEPVFYRTVVLLLDHGQHGSAGVVLNRPGDELVASLIPGLEPLVGPEATISIGGPVEARGVLGVTLGDAGELMPADLDEVIDGVPLKIYRGYAGWEPGQLEAEVADEVWWVVPADAADVFGPVPLQRWYEVVARQNDRRRWYKHLPDDFSVN
ncbi:MAG: hypothetical protein GY925_09165 [Actinomycetia bacterium]|nr:hypothetical protein [Actinomycetes bacterium]